MSISSSLRLVILVSLVAIGSAAQQPAGDIKSREASEEKWTELSVVNLKMDSLPAISAGTAEFPGYTRELIRLQWRKSDPVDIYLIKPRGVSKPRVILYLYGHTSGSERFRNEQWCKSATQGGVAAVGFVSALSVERYQGRPMTKWFVSELQESLAATTHDVQKIISYLEARGDLDASRIGFYGQGAGATIAILAASVDSRISVLDLLDPWGDWPNWLKQSPAVPDAERAAYTTTDFLRGVSELDPVSVMPALTTSRIRLQQVVDDPVIPTSVRERLAAALPPRAQLTLYQNYQDFRKTWSGKDLWSWTKDKLRDTSPEGPSLKPAENTTTPEQGIQ
jgi:hypothetical protein